MEDLDRTTGGRRRAPSARRAMVAVLVVSLVVGLAWGGRAVPVGRMVGALRSWTAGMGAWGLVLFGVIDVLAVVAMVPGSALTLAAGTLFGPVGGTIVASVASTL